MRHAGGEQADGTQLVGLRELGFKSHTLGDVVDEDDAAYGHESRESNGAIAMLAMRQFAARVVRRNCTGGERLFAAEPPALQ